MYRKVNIAALASMVMVTLSLMGCAESSFELSPESRLPKWFNAAAVTRANASVTLDYYIYPWGGRAKFTLRDRAGHKLKAVTATVSASGPTSLIARSSDGRLPDPQYQVARVDGTVDIIEHRQRGDVFYMTDDPIVWERLAGTSPSKLNP